MITDDKKEEWRYYWALSHVVAHWTVYVGVLVLLITVGFSLSGGECKFKSMTQTGVEIGALIFLWFGEMYLVIRMISLGNRVVEKIGGAGFEKYELCRHPRNQCILSVVASVVTGGDVGLVRGKLDLVTWGYIIVLVISAVLIYCWRRRCEAQLVGMGEMRRA